MILSDHCIAFVSTTVCLQSILPEHLHGRVHSDKKKRKRDMESSAAATLAAQQAAATQALLAASMQGYPMNLAAFGSLAMG